MACGMMIQTGRRRQQTVEKLTTPLGEIRVYTDGVSTGYRVSPYYSQIRSLRENPPAGCWQISSDLKNQ